MSTYYYLMCDEHKEMSPAVTGAGGCLGDRDILLPKFILKHKYCNLNVRDDNSKEWEDYEEWTLENLIKKTV